jgi:hypothetical protein
MNLYNQEEMHKECTYVHHKVVEIHPSEQNVHDLIIGQEHALNEHMKNTTTNPN